MSCGMPLGTGGVSCQASLDLHGTECEAVEMGLAGGVCWGVAQCCPVCGMLDDCAAAAVASLAPLLLWPWRCCQVTLHTLLSAVSPSPSAHPHGSCVQYHDSDAGDPADASHVSHLTASSLVGMMLITCLADSTVLLSHWCTAAHPRESCLSEW